MLLKKYSIIPLLFGLAVLLLAFASFPPSQSAGDPGVQVDVFAGVTVNATPQAATVACSQGSGSIGRKTLVVQNAGGGDVTATGELRTSQDAPNFTSGYLAVSNVVSGTLASDTALPTEAAGRFCRISVVSANSSVVTVTLRRE